MSLTSSFGRIVTRMGSRRVFTRGWASFPSTFDEEVEKEENRFNEVFDGNRRWIARMKKERPTIFQELSVEQKPRYLFIGCSDSRVPAQEITGLHTGELFVHRNVSNLVVNTDMNLLSVLHFAIKELKVKHIIVCGHHGCGGVKKAMGRIEDTLIDNWLRNIRDVQRLHFEELKLLDEESRYRRLVELNVREQCLNLFKTAVVQKSLHETGFPRVHGLVYEIRDGILKEISLGNPHELYESIYS